MSLLPPNATAQEQAIESATARISDVPILIRESWNPALCKAELLPWLAWAFSVDNWNADWTDAQKRQTIAQSVYVHRHKGTLGAVRKALETIGLTIQVVEWFQTVPMGEPYTFTVFIDVSQRGSSDAVYDEALSVIDRTKNVRSHLAALTLRGSVVGSAYISGSVMSGVTTTVYPYQPGSAGIASPICWALSEQSVDTVAIYPRVH